MKVIDSRNVVIAEGSLEHCNAIIRLAYCHPADVREEDELMYGDFLYGKGWAGILNVIDEKE